MSSVPTIQTSDRPQAIHAIATTGQQVKPSLPPHVLRALATIYDLADQRLREHEQAQQNPANQIAQPQQ